jgi:hypothetical protein
MVALVCFFLYNKALLNQSNNESGMSNSTTIGSTTSYQEAHTWLFRLIKELLTVSNILPSTNIEWVKATNGFILRLHNPLVRPTVYHVEVKRSKYDSVASMVIDTIVKENETHSSLKVTYSITTIDELGHHLCTLAKQPCRGTPEETSKRFSPIGLMYRKNETDNA